jgi:hypothetical protein
MLVIKYSKLLSFLVVTLIASGFYGCAKTEKSNNRSAIAWQPIFTNDPIFFGPELNNCQSESTGEPYKESFFVTEYLASDQIFITSKIQLEDFVFANPISSIKSENSISEVVYGVEEKRILNTLENKQSFRKVSDGNPLTVCPKSDVFATESIESVALSAIPIVHESYLFGKSLLGSTPLPPVRVSLLPKETEERLVKEDGEFFRVTRYMTDNAYYSPRETTIALVPQSKEKKEQRLFSGVPLWKIPFAVSHEYGHHVFHQIFPNFFEKFGHSFAHRHDKNCFHRSHSLNSPMGNSIVAKKSHMTPKDDSQNTLTLRLLRVFDEGFADLFSFYTLGDRASLERINCLERTREVDSKVFGNNDPKSIDPISATQFFEITEESRRKFCIIPDFSDFYTIAAIWAHFFDSLLSTVTEDRREKAQFLIDWLIDFKQVRYFDQVFMSLVKQSKHEQAYIYSVKHLLGYLDQRYGFGGQLDESQCSVVTNTYTAFYEDLVEPSSCRIIQP